MKNLKLTALLLLIVIQTGCSKSGEDDLKLDGVYTESIPHPGTHQLNFIDKDTMVLKARNSTVEEFVYQLRGNALHLTPTRDLSQTWELELNFIDNATVEITNIFYASIPEDDDSVQFVTFQK